jgi:hypothetical protein
VTTDNEDRSEILFSGVIGILVVEETDFSQHFFPCDTGDLIPLRPFALRLTEEYDQK